MPGGGIGPQFGSQFGGGPPLKRGPLGPPKCGGGGPLNPGGPLGPKPPLPLKRGGGPCGPWGPFMP